MVINQLSAVLGSDLTPSVPALALFSCPYLRVLVRVREAVPTRAQSSRKLSGCTFTNEYHFTLTIDRSNRVRHDADVALEQAAGSDEPSAQTH